MAAAYFLTATILIIWAYYQTRTTARNIRLARDARPCPLCLNGNSGLVLSAKEKPAA